MDKINDLAFKHYFNFFRTQPSCRYKIFLNFRNIKTLIKVNFLCKSERKLQDFFSYNLFLSIISYHNMLIFYSIFKLFELSFIIENMDGSNKMIPSIKRYVVGCHINFNDHANMHFDHHDLKLFLFSIHYNCFLEVLFFLNLQFL